jgi:hypothetical protein
MQIFVGASALSRIWTQLNAHYRAGLTRGRRTAHEEIIKEGWGSSVDVQDVLWGTDDRSTCSHGIMTISIR